MSEFIICSSCRRPYPEQGVPFQCPTCGGIYQITALPEVHLSTEQDQTAGMWRYRDTFGLDTVAPLVSLGEGQTPLVWSEAFGRQVAFKLEFLNPTGSYKDRGSAVLTCFLKSRGVNEAVEDSSGNAGASFAAYAARSGIRARIFIPSSASGPKRNQIEAYGAELINVPGPRSEAANAVRQAALQGAVYASHAYLPQGIPGYATIAYEMFEQLGGVPGTVISPAGQGNLLLGIGLGFKSLQTAGLLDRLPTLIGVQARACAPLWAAANYGADGLAWVSEGDTLAEGVRVRHPVRGDAVLNIIAETNGLFLAVDEEEILPGRDQLALQGFYVEPTSAIVWSALQQLAPQIPGPVVVILTGSGLKSTNFS
jgi:threonine synthase